MARGLSKTEIRRLGCVYAETLLRDPSIRPEDMPELTNHAAWREKGQHIKNDIVWDIRSIARGQLLEAGYNRETVIRVIGF